MRWSALRYAKALNAALANRRKRAFTYIYVFIVLGWLRFSAK
jgi:uncharacterized membrane protein